MVRSAIDDVMPGSDRLPGCGDLELDAFVARFLRETSWPMWLATTGSAAVYQITPILTVYLPLPSCWLPSRLADRHAQRICDHRLYPMRQAAAMIKTVMGLHWGAHPRIREAFALPAYPDDPGTWRRGEMG